MAPQFTVTAHRTSVDGFTHFDITAEGDDLGSILDTLAGHGIEMPRDRTRRTPRDANPVPAEEVVEERSGVDQPEEEGKPEPPQAELTTDDVRDAVRNFMSAGGSMGEVKDLFAEQFVNAEGAPVQKVSEIIPEDRQAAIDLLAKQANA